MKPFKVGATYKLKKSCVDKLWFTDSARTHCMNTYGTKHHVFIGECVQVRDSGGAYMRLENSDGGNFFASFDERKLFKRIDNK